MKRYPVLLLTLVLAFGLVGCIQMNMETQLQADGSGTFLMSYGMSPSVAEALKELTELGTMDEEMPNFTDLDKAQMEAACKKEGVTLKQFEEKDVDGAKHFTLELAFPNIEAFNNVMQASMGENGSGGMQLVKTDDGNYTLKGLEMKSQESEMSMGDDEESESSEPAKKLDPEAMGKSMEIMGKLMSSISELDISMKITVPGDIIESTAMRTEGRTAIWEINGQNMMSAEASGDPEVTFSGKGLKLDATGQK